MSIADPRDITDIQVGTTLRDAAVTPDAGDFLAPTNAGAAGELGNPHGPSVVSPGIHGLEEVRTIPDGDVPSDLAAQEAKAYANLALSQPQTVPPAP